MIFELMKTCFTSIFGVLAAGIAGILVIDGLRSAETSVDFLSRVFVRIALPCLMFHTMATKFDIAEVPFWWIFPLMGIGQFLIGGLLGYAYTGFDRSIAYPGVFSAAVAFHNSVLLPLAFAPALFSSDVLPRFLNLLFLYNLLTVPAFFTIGVWMVHSSTPHRLAWKDLINPPVVATSAGIIFALGGWGHTIPKGVMDIFSMLGSLSTPLSVLIVGGAIVGSISKSQRGLWREPVLITILKSLVLPTATTAIVYFLRPPADIALFLIMGSVMPVGSIVAVIIPDDQRIRSTIAGSILLSNLASIAMVPIFLSIYGVLYGW